MYVCYLCMYAGVSRVCELRPKWGSKGSRQQSLNITCNQQMTTQKMEGAEIEGLGRGRRRGGGMGGGTNMIIASIFAFFYFRLGPDARNHHRSIPDFPLFFRFSCATWRCWFVCTSCSFSGDSFLYSTFTVYSGLHCMKCTHHEQARAFVKH